MSEIRHIFITGGTGYLGGALLPALLARGHRVTALARRGSERKLPPGHRWPYALVPFYALCERLPATRDTARRLGLVKLRQMVNALVWAVENPAEEGRRVLDVMAMRNADPDSFGATNDSSSA